MPEEPQTFKVLDEKDKVAWEITPEEVEIIARSRGEEVEPYGFAVDMIPVKQQEAHEIINAGDFIKYDFPLTKGGFKKVGRFRREYVWDEPKPTTTVYYTDDGVVFLYHHHPKNEMFMLQTQLIYPTQDERADYEFLDQAYKEFLASNDMQLPITSQGEIVNSPKIISDWADTRKVDVFSDIDEEQRKNIVQARRIAARIWMPEILTQIHQYLRLGHSVKRKLMDTQQKTVIKMPRPHDEDEDDEKRSWKG
jgi:hypothetical protein